MPELTEYYRVTTKWSTSDEYWLEKSFTSKEHALVELTDLLYQNIDTHGKTPTRVSRDDTGRKISFIFEVEPEDTITPAVEYTVSFQVHKFE